MGWDNGRGQHGGGDAQAGPGRRRETGGELTRMDKETGSERGDQVRLRSRIGDLLDSLT